MSKFLLLGLSLDDVLAMATTAPATALDRPGLSGSLAVGSEADVTVLALEEGRFQLTDAAGTMRETRQRLVPVAVVRGGRALPIEPLVTEPPAGISQP
jgi:dihydroorotase